jgi:hypothetical protein
MYSPPDPDTEQRMRTHHARAAKVLDVQTEPGGECWGGPGALGRAPVRTAAVPRRGCGWCPPADKASGSCGEP